MNRVDVELVGLAARGDDAGGPVDLTYAMWRAAVPAGVTADETARSLCPAGVEVLHSTSWRQEPTGLVLTYVAAPVPGDPDMVPLIEPSIVCSGDPLRPSPPDVHGHHVVAHAVRHLAYLMTRDPGVASAAAASGAADLWQLVRAAAEIPTDTHRAAHARAHRTHAHRQ